MNCPKCGAHIVTVTVVNDVKLKDKHHGFLWWLCVGWYWVPFKWLFLTLPALIFKIFSHKKQTVVIKQRIVYCCHNCGYTWNK